MDCMKREFSSRIQVTEGGQNVRQREQPCLSWQELGGSKSDLGNKWEAGGGNTTSSPVCTSQMRSHGGRSESPRATH